MFRILNLLLKAGGLNVTRDGWLVFNCVITWHSFLEPIWEWAEKCSDWKWQIGGSRQLENRGNSTWAAINYLVIICKFLLPWFNYLLNNLVESRIWMEMWVLMKGTQFDIAVDIGLSNEHVRTLTSAQWLKGSEERMLIQKHQQWVITLLWDPPPPSFHSDVFL